MSNAASEPDLAALLASNSGGGMNKKQRWSGRRWAIITMGIVLLIQVFYTTAGRFTRWESPSDYIHKQADGFVHGELSVRQRPAPELVASPDRYKPEFNRNYRLHDALLYKAPGGEYRYYLYYGPVPALLLSPVLLLRPALDIQDQQMMMLFSVVLVAFSALILIWMRERLIPETPTPLLCLGVAMTGLLPTYLFTVARPMIYEASIIGGQAFLVMGVYFALLGAGARLRWLWLLAAGVAWALAIGTRASLGPAVAVMCLLIALRVWMLVGIRNWRTWLVPAVALAVPVAVGAVGLLTFNKLRFGEFTEFGWKYQLAGANMQEFISKGGLSSWKNIDVNATMYLFCPLGVMPQFPFLGGGGSIVNLRLHHYVAPYHGFEPTAGLFWSSPLLWFALAPILLAALEWRKIRTNSNLEKWLSVLLPLGAVAAIFPALMIAGTTMRYQMDALPLLAILAALGLWQVVRPFVRAGRSYYTVSGIIWVLSAWTFLVALAFGFTGYQNLFEHQNPKLYHKIEKIFT